MIDESAPWIVDTGPLSHFAKAGWLSYLKLIAGERPVVIPDLVHQELLDGANRHPHLSAVLAAAGGWITVQRIDTVEGLVALAKYTQHLLGPDGRKNLGECGVLALAEVTPGTAILDDRAARNLADAHSVARTGTVALLLTGIRDHGLPQKVAAAIADDLLATDYRLPFGRGDFVRWCIEQGLLDHE